MICCLSMGLLSIFDFVIFLFLTLTASCELLPLVSSFNVFHHLYLPVTGSFLGVSLTLLGLFVLRLRSSFSWLSAVDILQVPVALCSMSLPVGNAPSPWFILAVCCFLDKVLFFSVL